jgi:hypothetical protein
LKIYVQRTRSNAWKWISNGYAHAFAYLDNPVTFIDDLLEIKTNDPYLVFFRDETVNTSNIHILEKSFKTFLYVQSNIFPGHWGKSDGWKCFVENNVIEKVNELPHVKKWTFSSALDLFNVWKDVSTVPLAFDNVNYVSPTLNDYSYDICFIGGVANNGFNEKIKIIQEVLNSFVSSGLRCGFSVNNNVSHEIENQILSSSKVALNIHDLYQRTLGFDCNERTFKSLGVNGLLVSDLVTQSKDLFPFCTHSNNTDELIEKTKSYCSLSNRDLNVLKEFNKNIIEKEHTYIKRVEKLLSL